MVDLDDLNYAYRQGRENREESWSRPRNPYRDIGTDLALAWASGWDDVNAERIAALNPKR